MRTRARVGYTAIAAVAIGAGCGGWVEGPPSFPTAPIKDAVDLIVYVDPKIALTAVDTDCNEHIARLSRHLAQKLPDTFSRLGFSVVTDADAAHDAKARLLGDLLYCGEQGVYGQLRLTLTTETRFIGVFESAFDDNQDISNFAEWHTAKLARQLKSSPRVTAAIERAHDKSRLSSNTRVATGPSVPSTTVAPTRAPDATVVGDGGWPLVSTPLGYNKDGWRDSAVIVAIEDYAYLADVPGAKRNGQAWYDYLTKTRGVPVERIRFLVNADGTREEILTAAGQMGAASQAGGRTWFVFIGHGAPKQDQKDGLLVSADAQQKVSSLESRSVAQAALLAELGRGPGTPVAVIDACYSGRRSDGDALVPGLQPSAVVQTAVPSTAVVLTAAQSDQFAGPLPGDLRPAFSYLALGGLRGWADGNGDGLITGKELGEYTSSTLRVVLSGARSQSPQARGWLDMPLSEGREKGPDLTELVKALRGR